MRLQPRLVLFICALVPIIAAGTIPRRTSKELPTYNYDAMVKNPQMENQEREVEERRSGRSRTYMNSGLLFGKRFQEAADDFINDDVDTRQQQFTVETRGRNRLPFHSGLMQGKRSPLEEQVESSNTKRSRPKFHSAMLLGKRLSNFAIDDADDTKDIEDFKRKASRLRWSNGISFGRK